MAFILIAVVGVVREDQESRMLCARVVHLTEDVPRGSSATGDGEDTKPLPTLQRHDHQVWATRCPHVSSRGLRSQCVLWEMQTTTRSN